MTDVYSDSRKLDVGDVQINVTDHGPEDGEVVVLIHGWPDAAWLWRHQIPVLSEAGFRVLAPDLRGFGQSDKPSSVDDYSMGRLGSDIAAILDDVGADTAHVVGHDWGAGIAWYLAIAMSPRLRSMTALSVGHPSAFESVGIRQLSRSWYMFLFNQVDIAETWLSANDWANFRAFCADHPQIESSLEGLRRPGALTSSLAIYRANRRPERLIAPPREFPPVQVPVMGVWSTGDFALLEEQMTRSADHVKEFRYERIEGASHWIPLDAPDQLNRLLLEWLASH